MKGGARLAALIAALLLLVLAWYRWRGSDGHVPSRPDILLVLFDDVGWIDFQEARTPVLDSLAAEGTTFTRCWAAPACSPTRAAILSGVYPFRTGVGKAIAVGADWGLSSEQTYLSDLLRAEGYATGTFGKWHVTSYRDEGPDAPAKMGFDHHAGARSGNVADYFDWPKLENGRELGRVSEYVTTVTVDDLLGWLEHEAARPWFAWLQLNAAHLPLHAPPRRLLSAPLPRDATDRDRFLAAVEAADAELGRLLDGLALLGLGETLVLVLGDNGPPFRVRPTVFGGRQCKGYTAEGGLRTPLFVRGPGVPAGRRVEALVGAVDLWATILELASVPRPPGLGRDSASILPLLEEAGGGVTPGKSHQYMEWFLPNADPALGEPKLEWRRAVSDGEWKLVDPSAGTRDGDAPRELYHVANADGTPDDELERVDLYGDGTHASVRERLEAALLGYGGE